MGEMCVTEGEVADGQEVLADQSMGLSTADALGDRVYYWTRSYLKWAITWSASRNSRGISPQRENWASAYRLETITSIRAGSVSSPKPCSANQFGQREWPAQFPNNRRQNTKRPFPNFDSDIHRERGFSRCAYGGPNSNSKTAKGLIRSFRCSKSFEASRTPTPSRGRAVH